MADKESGTAQGIPRRLLSQVWAEESACKRISGYREVRSLQCGYGPLGASHLQRQLKGDEAQQCL